MNFIKNKILNTPILLIVFIGLAVRLLYYIFIAKLLLGNTVYVSGDTSGWTESFFNLIHHGHYTFDFSNIEASFGRVPGYSFFWGLNYFIGGYKYVYQTVALSQIILDSVSIYLIYKISLFIFNNSLSAKMSALLYCFYPFVIIWVTVSYSEIFSNFLNILCIYLALKPNKKNKHYFLLGSLLAVLFLTREFVAISLLFIIIYTFFEKDVRFYRRLKSTFIISISFLLLYSLWPIRNYINHDRFILTRSNEGFPFYNKDFSAFRSWITCWDNDEIFWLVKTVTNNYDVKFPKAANLNTEDQLLMQKTLHLCRSCGTSFANWENQFNAKNSFRKKDQVCNELIANNFDVLRSKFINNNPIAYYSHVPFKNLKKIIFKNQLVNRDPSLSQTMAFSYRSLLIVLGIIGIGISLKRNPIKNIPVAGYIIFIYFFFSLIIRHIEMRNLIQADTLLLVYSGFTIVYLSNLLSITPIKKVC